MIAFNPVLQQILTRRAAVLGGAAAIVALHAPALGQNATPVPVNPDATPGGVLRLGVQGDPVQLDPALEILDATGLVVDFIFEGLLHEGPDLSPQPRIAESWTVSDDALTYTFTLRPNVMFHNGRALVAADVKYSFERLQDPDIASPWAGDAGNMASIDAPDDSTVVITLSAPNASILSILTKRGFSIVPQEVVEEFGDLRQNPVGSGPFSLVEFVPNSHVTLAKNAEYWLEGRPYLDGLEIQVIPDDTARTTALVSGTVDMIEALPAKDYELIDADANLDRVGGESSNLRWFVFNTRIAPWENKEVRRAIAEGIVRQQIIDAAVFGYGQPLLGMYPESFWAGYPHEAPEGDPAAAKVKLDELGLTADVQPGILTWGEYDFLLNTSTVVQEQLRQMGINSELEPVENATYLERYFSGDFDVAVMGAGGYRDPDDYLRTSLMTDGVTNAAGWSSPELDALLQEAVAEPDLEKRRELYIQIQDAIVEEAMWIILYTSESFTGMSTRVAGFEPYLSQSMIGIRDAWLTPQ